MSAAGGNARAQRVADGVANTWLRGLGAGVTAVAAVTADAVPVTVSSD